MIEWDVIAYLKADVTLDGLLRSNAIDSKIYPIQVPQKTALPYIVYNTPSDGSILENINELSMSFDCISDDYNEAKDIKDRLVTLLDRENAIRDLIPSANYWFYWCKKVGGSSFKEPELNYFHRVAIFDFLWNELARGVVVGTIFPVDLVFKTLSINVSGSVIDEEVVFNGYYFPRNSTVTKLSLHARTAPVGDDIIVDILKDDAEQTRLASLNDGVKYQTTDIADIIFTNGERFGLKVKNIGSTVAGEDLTVVIYYR